MSTPALSEIPIEQVIAAHRAKIRARFGIQDYPDGTGPTMRSLSRAEGFRKEVEHARTAGTLTWNMLLREEVAEVRCESDRERLAEEIVDTVALLEEWLDALRRRERADPAQSYHVVKVGDSVIARHPVT